MANNFTWFNKPPSFDASAGKFTPAKTGFLSGLGKSLSGVSAPFVGDMDWAVKQQQLQQKADQADMEFQRYMMISGSGKSVFTFDPATNQVVPVGVVPKGSQVMAPQYTPEEKIQQAVQKSELTKTAELLPKMDQALEAVRSLKDQYYKAVKPAKVESGDISGGLKARASGLLQGAKSAAGSNPDLNVFKSDKGAFASLISKGGFLEAGMLTNQDITRVLQSLPDEGSTEKEATTKWAKIDDILGKARQKYEAKLKKIGGGSSTTEASTQEFNVGGKLYRIPADKVDAFKKAKGIK